MKNKNLKLEILTLAVATGLVGIAQARPAEVYLNGQPLHTSVAPVNQNGRLLVPLRDIFEGLGANVNYSDFTHSISANRGNTNVQMTLGSRLAQVNGQRVTLDVPAKTYGGRTMVPLRFVSEAMGASVNYNPARYLVSINSNGAYAANPGSGTQVGGFRQISIPANTVVPVTLDQTLSSADASVGQTFTATVASSQPGDSEFPAGTHIRGVVTEVVRKSGSNPGVLDLRFRSATLPDGSTVPLQGQLTSLDSSSVTDDNGRIVAKASKGKSDTLKVVGIGAAAGFVLGRVLKKDGALPTILGALGGLIYDKTKNKDKAAEARVESGTRLGVRLDSPVTYRDTTGYYQQRSNFIRL